MRFTYLFLFSISCFLPSVSHSNTLQSYIPDIEKPGKFSGVVLYGDSSQLDIKQGFGVASTNGSPNTQDTIFRIGGLSRTITATLIAAQVALGRISFDDPLNRFFPDYVGGNKDKVTIHHLLTHSSGIPDYLVTLNTAWKMKFGANTPPPNGVEGVIQDILSTAPNFEPGQKIELSSSNYMLLGAILARLSNDTQSNIFTRDLYSLGLKDSGLTPTTEMGEDSIAIGYDFPTMLNPSFWFSRKKRLPMAIRNYEWDLASGGLYSTANDLFNFCNKLTGDMILPMEIRKRVFSRYYKKGANSFIGYGWEIVESQGQQIYMASGVQPGFYSFLFHNPDMKKTMVLLSNNGESSTARSRIQKEILNRMFEEKQLTTK